MICVQERFEDIVWWWEPVLGLAALAARSGNHERAAALMGASEAGRQFLPEADRPVFERVFVRFIAPARVALGETAWAHIEAIGAALISTHVRNWLREVAEPSVSSSGFGGGF